MDFVFRSGSAIEKLIPRSRRLLEGLVWEYLLRINGHLELRIVVHDRFAFLRVLVRVYFSLGRGPAPYIQAAISGFESCYCVESPVEGRSRAWAVN